MASSNGKHIITIHILPNIFRNKGKSDNETWSVDRIYMKNIFLEKLYAKYDGKIIYRSFSEKSKLSISLD